MNDRELAELEAASRHHRARFARYRAQRRTTPTRFRELERAQSLADCRLLHARRSSAHLN